MISNIKAEVKGRGQLLKRVFCHICDQYNHVKEDRECPTCGSTANGCNTNKRS